MSKLLTSRLSIAVSTAFVMTVSLSACSTDKAAVVNPETANGSAQGPSGEKSAGSVDDPNVVKIAGKSAKEKEAENRMKARQAQSMAPPAMRCNH